MKKLHRNKKRTGALIVLLLTGIWFFYHTFYRIDLYDENVYESWSMGTFWSQDEGYSVMMSADLYYDRDEYYIMGTLVKTEYTEEGYRLVADHNTRTIYWQKISETEIEQNEYIRWQDGIKADNNLRIDVVWIDDKTVQIADQILNIRWGSYDYRRDISRLFQR